VEGDTPIVQPSQEVAPVPDLDTPDELAIRSLLLGVLYCRLGSFAKAREMLDDVVRIHALKGKEGIPEEGARWVGGVAHYENAVVMLQKAKARPETTDEEWADVLKEAEERLDLAMGVSGNNVDLSSRLDSRVNMLRGEIGQKRDMLGLSVQ